MDILDVTEICAINWEKENLIENAEYHDKKLAALFPTKIRSNSTFQQRPALKELSQSTENKVYSYDKGTGFVILNNIDAIRKIEKQIRESVVSNTDPVICTYK